MVSLHVTTSLSVALAMGMISVLFPTLQALLEQRLGLAAGRLDRLHKILILSWVPLMPLAGWLLDRWGLREMLFGGSLILGLAVSWLALCQNMTGLVWGVLGFGVGGACITTAGVVLMPLALRFRGWSMGAALCLGYVFVGLAALLTPRILSLLIRPLGFRRTILSMGLLCLLPAFLVCFFQGGIQAPVVPDGSLRDIRFWLIALVAFLYFPLEFSLEIWPRPYLTEIGYTGRSILRLLVGFWCAFLLFRFGLGWMIRPGNEAWLILILLVVSSMILGNLAGTYAPSSGSFGFWMVGACYGPILPALLAILLDVEGPRGSAGEAVGFLFAISALSSLLVRPLFIAFAKNHPPRECMRIHTLFGLVMAAPMLVMALIRYGR